MLARPLKECDEGGRGLTYVTLPPGLPLATADVNGTHTGLSAPPCASLFFPPLPHFPTPAPSLPSSSSSRSPPPHFPRCSVLSSPPLHSPPPPSASLLHPAPSFSPVHSSSSCPPPHTSASSPTMTSPCISPSPNRSCPTPLSSSFLPLIPSFHPSPPLLSYSSSSPPSAPLPLLDHHISHLPPPPSSVSSVSPPSFLTPSPSSPPSLLSPSPSHTSAFPRVSPSIHPPPPPPACCPCASLLPRLLSAHRLEVRRLLRGALASLGRRLDSLERRAGRKRRKRRSRRGGEGLAAVRSSCSTAPIPTVASSSLSSSSDNEDSSTAPLSLSFSQSEQRSSSRGEEEGVRKRKRKRRINNYTDKGEEEEDPGRFVGRMKVSFRVGGGVEEEVLLTLRDFNHKEQGEICQSNKDVAVARQNGYSDSDLTSQHAFRLLQPVQSGRTSSQSEALCLSFGQWHFSDSTPSSFLSTNQTFSHLWLCSSFFSPASMLLLSTVSVETTSELLWGGALRSPLRPLKDWTAPPSLSSDHCYVRPSPSLTISAWRQQRQQANHVSRSLHLPRRRPLPLPPCSTNGLSAPFPDDQSASGHKFLSTNGERSKRVSQIRIRRATPRETPLTPMGLPKVKRLKKKEFSLEEIYTNKNYKPPPTNRCLETIFEEPREKDGELLLIGQQRRRRLLLFPDFTQPRKRKRPQGAGLPVAMVPRKRVARRHCHGDGSGDDDVDLDVMLLERLSALEDFMTRQGLDV